jgi:hypothetical protein
LTLSIFLLSSSFSYLFTFGLFTSSFPLFLFLFAMLFFF